MRRGALPVAAILAWLVGSMAGASSAPGAGASAFPVMTANKPIFILVVGINDQTEGNAADTIQVVALNPAKNKATIMGISYDYWVQIPGHGMSKIDAAYTYGGPKLLVQVVEALTGIHIDYYAVVGFDGFTVAINAVGGVTVKIPMTVYNSVSGGVLLSAGKHHLNGRVALEFARARDGLPAGDLSRSCDGGLILRSLLTSYQRAFAKDPSVLLTYLVASLITIPRTPSVVTDIPYQELLDLGFEALRLTPGDITDIVSPGNIGWASGQSIVSVDYAHAKPIWADIADDGVLNRHLHGAFTGIPSCE